MNAVGGFGTQTCQSSTINQVLFYYTQDVVVANASTNPQQPIPDYGNSTPSNSGPRCLVRRCRAPKKRNPMRTRLSDAMIIGSAKIENPCFDNLSSSDEDDND